MKNILFLLLVSSLLFTTTPAKSMPLDAGDQVKIGLAKQKFYAGDVVGALNLYKEVLIKNPQDVTVLHFVGLCHFTLKDYEKATEHFNKAKEIKTGIKYETYLYTGKLFQMAGKYDEALVDLNEYKKLAPIKESTEEDIEVWIDQCNTAKKLIASPLDVKVENMGPEINSKFDDQSPAISADGMKLVFNTRRPETTNSLMDVEGDGKYFQDIYYSDFDTLTKKWKQADDVPGSINTNAHDACTGISADGKIIFIYKNDLKDPQSRGGDIYSSKIVNGKWRTPENMAKPINTSYWEGGACISPDGKTLFFTSERPGGSGNSDIWMAKRLTKTTWDKPVNLGTEVNSAFDEVGLFLAPDGKTLFFCSNGKGSMGDYDIFKSTLENGKWTKPVNLGYPINSDKRDGPFVLSANAQTGYFASNRDGGLGESDIYQVDLSNYAVLEKDGKKVSNNGLSILKGVVRDGYEGYGVADVDIEFADESGAKIGSTITNENGEYFITLKGGVKYTMTLKKKGFKDLTEAVELKLGTKETFTLVKEFLLKK
ncbi:MAG: PD40 domain-containing protein [Bacteroidia bacterium]|nr:PD40 domain-containing protein [Bacteroidia bacterium]